MYLTYICCSLITSHYPNPNHCCPSRPSRSCPMNHHRHHHSSYHLCPSTQRNSDNMRYRQNPMLPRHNIRQAMNNSCPYSNRPHHHTNSQSHCLHTSHRTHRQNNTSSYQDNSINHPTLSRHRMYYERHSTPAPVSLYVCIPVSIPECIRTYRYSD